MQIRRVRTEEADLRRYVTECWFPYHEELSDTVGAYSLLDGLEVQDVVEHHLDLLDSPSNRLWVALDEVDDSTASLSSVDATFVGFVRTDLRPSPARFDWPDKLAISGVWVRDVRRTVLQGVGGRRPPRRTGAAVRARGGVR